MRLPFFAHKTITPAKLVKNDYMYCVGFGLPHRCSGQRASIYIVCQFTNVFVSLLAYKNLSVSESSIAIRCVLRSGAPCSKICIVIPMKSVWKIMHYYPYSLSPCMEPAGCATFSKSILSPLYAAQ